MARRFDGMRNAIVLGFLLSLFMPSCIAQESNRYIFFLHNRFLEEHGLDELHPSYGRVEYQEIIHEFEANGFEVISEKRNGNVNTQSYALTVIAQIDSLLQIGIKPSSITVVGTSKGGYIAQYVSTLTNNPGLNFVFIASFNPRDIEDIPEINFCGNILNISEKSDPFGVSALARKEASTCTIQHYKDLELNTGMQHGFLFKALAEWMKPTIRWAKEQYD